jgi:sugar phosphate isomerase/epimerase
MQLGIFSKVFARPTVEESLDAVRRHGLSCVQFNLATAGLASLPQRIDPQLCNRIRQAMAQRGITMAAVSGTFNMGHPDAEHRRAGLKRLGLLAAACPLLGTSVITLCTGTRDREDMWRWHADNDSKQAWLDMADTMAQGLEIAENANVTLAFEPEVSNIVDSAQKGRRLLHEMRSARLKVVMDAANLFHAGELPRMAEVLQEAFAALGEDIILAHAKDLSRDGEAGHEAAGFGLLDYELYLRLLHDSGFEGQIVLHGLEEMQVPECVRFMHEKLSRFSRFRG